MSSDLIKCLGEYFLVFEHLLIIVALLFVVILFGAYIIRMVIDMFK